MRVLTFLLAILLSSPVSSLNVTERSQALAKRQAPTPRMDCSDYYGFPDEEDCDDVIAAVRQFRIGPSGETSPFDENMDEFILRGPEDQYADCELHWQLPIYWETSMSIWRSSKSLFASCFVASISPVR